MAGPVAREQPWPKISAPGEARKTGGKGEAHREASSSKLYKGMARKAAGGGTRKPHAASRTSRRRAASSQHRKIPIQPRAVRAHPGEPSRAPHEARASPTGPNHTCSAGDKDQQQKRKCSQQLHCRFQLGSIVHGSSGGLAHRHRVQLGGLGDRAGIHRHSGRPLLLGQGHHNTEFTKRLPPAAKETQGDGAAGEVGVLLDHGLQLLLPRGAGRHLEDVVAVIRVAERLQVALRDMQVQEATAHASSHVLSSPPQDHDGAASHVLAQVVTDALNHG
mmetsp:Transcript_97932/g.134686  ORF Transcript_97932/g.134686 Transcript_97932/m.134686 type:complete len:276 (-) Transcript_97932:63-890(-)